jgi:hypothetical protein
MNSVTKSFFHFKRHKKTSSKSRLKKLYWFATKTDITSTFHRSNERVRVLAIKREGESVPIWPEHKNGKRPEIWLQECEWESKIKCHPRNNIPTMLSSQRHLIPNHPLVTSSVSCVGDSFCVFFFFFYFSPATSEPPALFIESIKPLLYSPNYW